MEDLVTMAKNESFKQQTSYPENKIVVLRDESAKFPLIAQMMTSTGLEAFFRENSSFQKRILSKAVQEGMPEPQGPQGHPDWRGEFGRGEVGRSSAELSLD